MQVGELLAERVSFGRDAADDAMGRSQLLHHHVQMTIEGAQSGIVIRAGHGRRGVLLLSAGSFQGASAAVRLLARQVDDERFGGGGFRDWCWIARRVVISGRGNGRSRNLFCPWRSRPLPSLPTGCSTVLPVCTPRSGRRRRVLGTLGFSSQSVGINSVLCGGNPPRPSLPSAVVWCCGGFRFR